MAKSSGVLIVHTHCELLSDSLLSCLLPCCFGFRVCMFLFHVLHPIGETKRKTER